MESIRHTITRPDPDRFDPVDPCAHGVTGVRGAHAADREAGVRSDLELQSQTIF